MFTPINPEQERIRAINALSAFTDYDRAVELLAPNARPEEDCKQVETSRRPTSRAIRHRGPSVAKVFKAVHAELVLLLKM